MLHTFTSQNFEDEVMKSELPVFVDFWAPWCGPCQMMGPVVEHLATDYEGKMKVGKINVDEPDNQVIAAQHGIRGIPAFKVFKGGQVIAEFVGARSEGDMKAEIDKIL